MLANVLGKTLRDRWLGWIIAAVVNWLFVLMGMLAYQGLDVSVIETFPEAYKTLLGLRPGMDAGALSISAIYATYGATVFAAMALAMGAASIAGEERAGTMGLLLGNPISRARVLAEKILALAVLSLIGTLAMWGASVSSAAIADIALGDLDLLAINVHMLANTLFYGMLAVAIGAATGNRGTALGVSSGVLAIGFLGAGLVPLLEGGEDWVRVFPWHYFNGSEPLYNGIDWGHVGLLLGGAVVFAVVAFVGLARRDLRAQSTGTTLLDRLRANQMTKKLADVLAGSARVSSIWIKTASEYQIMLLLTSAYMFFVQIVLGPFYAAIPDETFGVLKQLPEDVVVLFELFGGGDMTTPEGFIQIETFGMMGPIMVMIVAIAIGAGAIAGEEAKRTMGLLLANPIGRSRVIAEKTLTMVLFASLVGIASFAGTVVGSALGDLGISTSNVGATCILLTLIGIAAGALALAISAATGRKGVAIWGAVGVAVAFHVMNSLGEISGNPWWQKLSPFYYYLGGDPLNEGLDPVHVAVLAAIAIVLIAASFPLFQRRDVREKA